jgi:hypothetical protein
MNAAEYVTKNSRRTYESPPIHLEEIVPDPTCGTPDAPADEPVPVDARELRTFGLIELLLKNRRGLRQLLRAKSAQTLLLPRLLMIALTGFILFGITMSLVLTVCGRWPSLTAVDAWLEAPASPLFSFSAIDNSWGKLSPWLGGEALVLTGAYAFGLVAASGVALPSLYFYCLLAGIRMSMLEVVVHAVHSKAIAAVALVGIIPIYVALAMGVAIFDVGEFWLRATLLLGLVLPFIAGFWGTVSLYQGFAQLCDTMPADRAASRECFLRRLVISWAACYSAIMPVMIYSLWEAFSR